MTLPRFDYLAPETVEESVRLRKKHGDDVMVMAGGLTAVILLRERMVQPKMILSLSEIPELQTITIDQSGLRIGAMVTHNMIARSEIVNDIAPLVSKACGHVGSPAIRNMGTLGGNISHGDGASDPAPALLAMGAEAIIAGPERTRRVPLKSFFYGVFMTELKEEEILTALYIPKAKAGTRTRFLKYTSTSVEAFATVTVAISLEMNDDGKCLKARIGLGSVAPVPIRAIEAEGLLNNQKLTSELIYEVANTAMSETDPPSDGQASAEYRREMTGVWVRRVLEEMLPE